MLLSQFDPVIVFSTLMMMTIKLGVKWSDAFPSSTSLGLLILSFGSILFLLQGGLKTDNMFISSFELDDRADTFASLLALKAIRCEISVGDKSIS